MTRQTAWVVAAALWLAMPAVAARGADEVLTEYLAVMIDSEKVGYMVNERRAAEGKVTTTSAMEMSLNRGGFPMTVKQRSVCVETAAGKPLSFETSTDMGFGSTRTRGTVAEDGTMTLERSSGGTVAKETRPYPKAALMPEGMDLEVRRHGFVSGTSYELISFVAEYASGARTSMTVGERGTVDLFGRIAEGVRVTMVQAFQVETPMGPMDVAVPVVLWVTDENRVLRMDMDVAGMKVTAYQCDQAFAMSPAKSTKDFFDASLVELPKGVPATSERVTYVLKAKPGKEKELSIPTTDSQQVAAGPDGTVRVTVVRQKPKSSQTMPYAGSDAGALASMKPTAYVQSDDPAIVAAAREAVGDETAAWGAARRIAEWVRTNIRTKDLSIGYASASEVLKSRQGDCTEHSVLTAALCRAVGIPARTVSGMAYVGEMFGRKYVMGGHQWTQVFIGGQWVDLDATVQNVSYGPRSIALMVGNGDTMDFLSLLKSYGLFEVVDVEVGE
ncbi:MAG TPA: transglutaminase-like domain-containing protein [Phycisphaerae bacterium]|nr:transglutaminase domain-containing protein [Phycisphaerae bacterium]HOI56836.1 transglutaminase-like domain-containing protein [Phycisphaerae bacterium]